LQLGISSRERLPPSGKHDLMPLRICAAVCKGGPGPPGVSFSPGQLCPVSAGGYEARSSEACAYRLTAASTRAGLHRLGGRQTRPKFTTSYPFYSRFPGAGFGGIAPRFRWCSDETGGRGGIVKARLAEIDISKAPDTAISRKNHARLYSRACHLGGQHGHGLYGI
jgi:hypothetical protein